MQDSDSGRVFVRPGFRWDAADAYLFDIDGTLLNSRDAVHYFAFHNAVQAVLGIEASVDGIAVHGNTDVGILRAVLRRAGLKDEAVDASMAKIVAHMCTEVERNHEDYVKRHHAACSSAVEKLAKGVAARVENGRRARMSSP